MDKRARRTPPPVVGRRREKESWHSGPLALLDEDE
jgi:hypothetical protein